MVAITTNPQPASVISRSKLSQAVIQMGGEVVGLDIHIGIAEVAFADMMELLHPIAEAQEVEGDRLAYANAMDSERSGEYAKALTTLDQIHQTADKLEELAARLRKFENSVLIPQDGDEIAVGIANALTLHVGGEA